jgi:hypothetical protein
MSQSRVQARRRLRLRHGLLAALLVMAVAIPLDVAVLEQVLPGHAPSRNPAGAQATDQHSFQVVRRLQGLSDLVAGDGTYPVALPDGQTAWLFGDCRFKTPGGIAGVRNAILLQDTHGRFRLVTGHSGAFPTDLLPRVRPNTWLWPSSGYVSQGRLLVFAEEYKGVLDQDHRVGFVQTNHRYLFTLALPSLRPLPQPPRELYGGPIAWGHALLLNGPDVYVYGNLEQDHGWTNLTYLARFPLSKPASYWQFWDGRDFVPDPGAAVPLRGVDGARLTTKLSSIIPNPDPQARAAGSGVAAVTMQPFGATVQLRTAPRPEGPWSASHTLYQLPDLKQPAYLPRVRLEPDGTMQLAYSVWTRPPRFVLIK